MPTLRQRLTEILEGRPFSLIEIADQLQLKVSVINENVQHVLRTAKTKGYKVIIDPAICQRCKFKFSNDRLRRPGKCPECRGDIIMDATVEIVKI